MNQEDWIKAGSIAKQVRDYGEGLIEVGASLLETTDKIENKIKELGAKPAFPAQISLNEIAAHYCPDKDDKTIFKEGDVAKLDVGITVNGAIGDTATTIDLGDNKELVLASREALNNALSLVKPGIKLGEIGKTVEDTITKRGFNPVRNLSGHGLGEYQIHTPPSIPNYDNHDSNALSNNQTIAIEPFATTGMGMIEQKGIATIFSFRNKKPVRLPLLREFINIILREYNTLPFAKRWLYEFFPENKVNYALTQLVRQGILEEHPPLVEVSKGIVSQAEHSVIVANPLIITTK